MEIEQLPELRQPNIFVALQGWNDAGQAATTAVRYLIDMWKAQSFARIDPEEYFSFTDTRPIIRIVDGTSRELTWPRNEFFYYEGTETAPAAVLMLGTEPNLRWRSFCGEITRLAKSVGARRIVTLGSLITETAHTRPVPLTGFSTDPAVQASFSARGITRSSYEGPTGVVGVLHDACLRAEVPAASLWAASPYYLGATPNPKTALALLDTLDEALGLRLNLSEMRVMANEFERQVSRAVRNNSDVQAQIRVLEDRADAASGAEPTATPPEFPPTGTIIADLEKYLREQRDDTEGT